MNTDIRTRIGLVVVVLLLAGLAPARAQDTGETDADILVGRVVRARQDVLGWQSFTSARVTRDALVLDLAVGRQVQTAHAIVQADRVAHVVRLDGVPNVQSTINATINETIGMGPGGERAYALAGESRRVDGVLYVNAQYTLPRPDLPQLPRGWSVVQNPGEHAVFRHLPLGDFSEIDWMLADPDALAAAVTQAALEPGTLDNGTPVDVITLRMTGADLVTFFADVPVKSDALALVAQLSDDLTAESAVTLTAEIDSDSVLRAYHTRIALQTGWIDAYELDPETYPQGLLMRFAVEMTGDELFSAINVPRAPVDAPPMRF